MNLGFNNEGAYSLRFTLADYAKLSPDLAILYEGYNDLAGNERNTQIFRRQSIVFRLTGYFPMLPVVMNEKLMALRQGGDLRAAYRGDKIVFHPTVTQRMAIGVLEGATLMSDAMAGSGARTERAPHQMIGADRKVAAYCDDMALAVRLARSRGVAVLVVGQPITKSALRDAHRAQQHALVARIATDFGNDPLVRYIGLENAIDLDDRALCWDGMHLTPAGNAIIADALTTPVLAAMASGHVGARRGEKSATVSSRGDWKPALPNAKTAALRLGLADRNYAVFER